MMLIKFNSYKHFVQQCKEYMYVVRMKKSYIYIYIIHPLNSTWQVFINIHVFKSSPFQMKVHTSFKVALIPYTFVLFVRKHVSGYSQMIFVWFCHNIQCFKFQNHFKCFTITLPFIIKLSLKPNLIWNIQL